MHNYEYIRIYMSVDATFDVKMTYKAAFVFLSMYSYLYNIHQNVTRIYMNSNECIIMNILEFM